MPQRGDVFAKKGDINRDLSDYNSSLGLAPSGTILFCNS